MANLTYAQLQAMARQAGFSTTGSSIMAAIALAESGGNPAEYNPSDPNGGSFGILQINGDWMNRGLITTSCAENPPCAMAFAFTTISHNGTSFGAWSTYSSGAYKQYLQSGGASGLPPGVAQPIGTNNSGNGIQQAAGNILNGAASIVDFSWLTNSPLWQWIQDPVRVVKMIVGIALLLLALYLLISPAGERVTKEVLKAAEKGATA